MPGVVRTRAGYAGGTKKDPTYEDLGDHTETLQFDYDPTQITYEQLLAAFWNNHNPCEKAPKRQYMTAVFYHNDEQKKLALQTRLAEAAKHKGPVTTEVLPLGAFYLAEDYHQKYTLQQHADLMKEFRALYPDFKDFNNSTAVARVNGFLSGYGSAELLRKEIDGYGLSPAAQKKLLAAVGRNGK